MKKPPKWTEVYPQGTPEGDEEQRFFIALVRDKYKFKSISQISSECHMAKEQIERIISKYAKLNIVIQNPKNEDQWGYWENCVEIMPEKSSSIAEKDKKKRIAQMRNDK